MSAVQEGTQQYIVERPADVSDARWEALKLAASRVLTGHYPWCTDHAGHDDGSDSWCVTAVNSGGGLVTMSTGTVSGLPELWIDAPAGHHGHIEELSPAEAWQLGDCLMKLADAAEKAPFQKALGKS